MKESAASDDIGNWENSRWYKNILIPIICQMPLVIKFTQCIRKYIDTGDRFPHLANSFEFALAQLLSLTAAFHPLYLEVLEGHSERFPLYTIFWTILFISSSLYSCAWDVYVEWGLGRKDYAFLGPGLMYPNKYFYYCSMVMDLVLRFMWVLTLVPPSAGASFAIPEYLFGLQVMLELFRRTVWGFLRLENEHRCNVSGYRHADFVPLHFDTGHKHMYEDKKKKTGSDVLSEVILVTFIVAIFCIASIIAAQRATSNEMDSFADDDL